MNLQHEIHIFFDDDITIMYYEKIEDVGLKYIKVLASSKRFMYMYYFYEGRHISSYSNKIGTDLLSAIRINLFRCLNLRNQYAKK